MIPSSRDWQKYLDWCANNYHTINAYFYRFQADEGTERNRFTITVSYWDGYEHVADEITYHFWNWCASHLNMDVDKFELPKAWVNDIFAGTQAQLKKQLDTNMDDWSNFIENRTSSDIWIQP